MSNDTLLEYTGKCGCWFRACMDNWEPRYDAGQLADMLAPPLDSDKVCQTRMVRYLMRQGNILEGVLFPEHVVAGLELLRGNARTLAFQSVNS